MSGAADADGHPVPVVSSLPAVLHRGPGSVRVCPPRPFRARASSLSCIARNTYLWIIGVTTPGARPSRIRRIVFVFRAEAFRFGRYYFILVLRRHRAVSSPGPWLPASRAVRARFRRELHDLHRPREPASLHPRWRGVETARRAHRAAAPRPAIRPVGERPKIPVTSMNPVLIPDSAGCSVRALQRRAWLRYSPVVAFRCSGWRLLDQTQFWLTFKHSGQPALALAQAFRPQDTRVYFQKAQDDVRQPEKILRRWPNSATPSRSIPTTPPRKTCSARTPHPLRRQCGRPRPLRPDDGAAAA